MEAETVMNMADTEKEVAAFVCSHVFEQTKPILLVSREDGDWQFLCGEVHAQEEVPRVVGINHLLDRDPTLLELMDLPPDWEAERASNGAPWMRRELGL